MRRDMSIKHRSQAAVIRLLMGVFALLPLDKASALGSMIGRAVGPRTGIHRKARRQMLEILTTSSLTEIDQYLNEMWDNLGRTMAEYPHLPQIMNERLTLDDRYGVDTQFIRDNACIFIAGHFANWEVAGPSLLKFSGAKLDLLYRAANNGRVDDLLNHYRSMNGVLTTIPKSRAGMRALVEGLKAKRKIGILIDQKYNEGIPVPFFGKLAMASPAFAQLGQKFNCPVYPAQIIRTNGAHFTVVLYPPLKLMNDDGSPRDAYDVVVDAHDLMETWMRERPGQWLWVHQRWSSKKLASMAEAA